MPSTTYKGLEIQSTGSNSGTWGSVLNSQALEYVDLNLGGITSQSLTNVNLTLSASESRNLILRCIGVLTGNVQITTACQGFFFVDNSTSGNFSLTITNGVGTPTVCPQGYRVGIIADATNGCRLANNPPASAYVASSITTAAIADANVTMAKIANIATSRLLGRTTASSGSIEEITVGAGLTFGSNALSVTTPSPFALISTTTVSGSASLPITSGIDGTYDEFELHVADCQVSADGVTLRLQVSTNGGSSFETTTYTSGVFVVNSSGGSGGDSTSSGILLTSSSGSNTMDSSSSYSWRGVIRFWSNGSSTRKNFNVQGSYQSDGNGFTSVSGAGVWNGGNTAINAIRIIPSSGTVSGTARLIGVKNS